MNRHIDDRPPVDAKSLRDQLVARGYVRPDVHVAPAPVLPHAVLTLDDIGRAEAARVIGLTKPRVVKERER